MKYVEITSTVAITVTNRLESVDKTNYGSKTGNNLNVKPLWFKTAIDIRPDRHVYPAEIAEWPTVQALHNNRIITIGRETDTLPEDDKAVVEKYETAKAEIEAELAPTAVKTAKGKKIAEIHE